MRCLALAQSWRHQGGRVIFLSRTRDKALQERILGEDAELIHLGNLLSNAEDLKQTLTLIAEKKPAEGKVWVVVDGYDFNADYQRQIKAAGYNLLCIDDYGHADHYFADIVLNQNISAHESLYKNREPYTGLLLGPRYTLLRKEFGPWREWKRFIPEFADKILVTLGGSDPGNATMEVVNAITRINIPALEVNIIAGPANPHIEKLRNAIDNTSGTFHLLENVTNMAEMMAWADVAITSGGSTCWELSFFQLPFIVIVVAENQRPSMDRLKALGLTKMFSFPSDTLCDDLVSAVKDILTNHSLRNEWSRGLSSLVDGKGADRICDML